LKKHKVLGVPLKIQNSGPEKAQAVNSESYINAM
jgi:subtilase family serine protease